MTQYMTTRPFSTAARQYGTGEDVDVTRLTNAEWIRGTESGAVIPAYFIGGNSNMLASAAQQFELSPRTVPAFAVPTLRPRNDGPIAFDVMPRGPARADTWIDICDQDILTASSFVTNVARLYVGSNFGAVGGTVWGGTPSAYQFSVRTPTDAAGGWAVCTRWNSPVGGVAAADDYTITNDPVIILGFHGGSVVSNIWRLKQAATLGFFHIPTINGAPSGVPGTIGSGSSVPLAYDKGAHTLWAYEYGGGGWKSVVFT